MSNRMFQSVIHQTREAIDRTVGIVDEGLTVIACSDLGRVGAPASISEEAFSTTGTFVLDGFTYCAFGSRPYCEYVVFVEGTDESADRYASLLSVTLANLKQYYDEKYDRRNFIKNVILDNILPGDVFIKARELHLEAETPRVAILIRLAENSDVSAYDILQNLFPDKQKDFIINVNETDIVLVK